MTFRQLVSLCVLAATPAVVSNAEPLELSAQPLRVAVFKNGLCLLDTEARLPSIQGDFLLAPPSTATFGGVWISSTEDVTLADIKLTQIPTVRELPVNNLPELLAANPGRSVALKVQDTWQTVQLVAHPGGEAPPPQPLPEPQWRIATFMPRRPEPSGQLLFVRDDQGLRAFPLQWVQEVRFLDDTATFTKEESTPKPMIRFTASASDANSSATPAIHLHSLAQGLAWAPSYVIDISRPDSASLHGQALLVNDLTPLHDTEVELIVGYPQLPYADAPSWLSLDPLAQLLQRLRDRDPAHYTRGMPVLNQAVGYEVIPPNLSLPLLPTSPAMGENAEDLYYYRIGKITLDTGERGYYPLLSARVPYQHIYSWDIADAPAEQQVPGQNDQQTQIVWHALKLTNTGQEPWTTAPVMLVQGPRLLGQATLQYTAPGGATRVNITRALDVDAKHTEREIARERDTRPFYTRPYDKVTVQGELVVTNYKAEPVTLEVTKLLTGEVTEAQGEPLVEKVAQAARVANPRSRLQWQFDVPPGPDRVVRLVYTYVLYLPA